MDVIIDRCCGLDVHKDTVVACLLVTNGKRVRKEIRTFRTFTSELKGLAEWLVSEGCTHVGMESTGVYWMPVYAVLEETELELIVGNARHIRNVPGRKTDVKDAEWIARLIRNGLIRPSFVPCKEQRELRDFVRFRKSLVQQRTSERNRLLKLLEQANIKLRSVVSDVFGKSGLAMLEALVENKKTPEAIVALARGRLKQKRADLLLALDGRVKPHHRQLLRLQLDRLSQLQHDIEAVELEIKARVEKHSDVMDRLQTGIGETVAAIVLAEVGTDVEAFSSDHGLAGGASRRRRRGGSSAARRGPPRTRWLIGGRGAQPTFKRKLLGLGAEADLRQLPAKDRARSGTRRPVPAGSRSFD